MGLEWIHLHAPPTHIFCCVDGNAKSTPFWFFMANNSGQIQSEHGLMLCHDKQVEKQIKILDVEVHPIQLHLDALPIVHVEFNMGDDYHVYSTMNMQTNTMLYSNNRRVRILALV